MAFETLIEMREFDFKIKLLGITTILWWCNHKFNIIWIVKLNHFQLNIQKSEFVTKRNDSFCSEKSDKSATIC